MTCVTPQNWATLNVMWSGSYSCMPYMVALPTGDLVSSLTVSATTEGAVTQHVIVLRSNDGGVTWVEGAEIEPTSGPESSWGMLWHDPDSKRLYIFYLYNHEDVRFVPNSDNIGGTSRADSIGCICWRASVDGGLTWGERQECPPLSPKAIDLRNPFQGKKRLLWPCGHPVARDGKLYLGFSKIGTVKDGNMFTDTEAFLLCIDQQLLNKSIHAFGSTDSQHPKVMELPKGESGIKVPGNPINEEPSPLVFEDGVINAVFRTATGQLGEAWSVDGGETFSVDWARERDRKTIMCQPRAIAAQFLLPDGRVFLWHHNNTWPDFGKHRNPVWYSIGERVGPRVQWGPPYVLCYDTDPAKRITYPSLVVLGDEILISATDKSIAKLMRLSLSNL